MCNDRVFAILFIRSRFVDPFSDGLIVALRNLNEYQRVLLRSVLNLLVLSTDVMFEISFNAARGSSLELKMWKPA